MEHSCVIVICGNTESTFGGPAKAGHRMTQQILKSTGHRQSLRSPVVTFTIAKSRHNCLSKEQKVTYTHDKVLFCPTKIEVQYLQ